MEAPHLRRKDILTLFIQHTDTQKHFFHLSFSMLWHLFKYMLKGYRISVSTFRACDREEYHITFYAESTKKDIK